MKKLGYLFLILLMIGVSITPIKAINLDTFHSEIETEEDISIQPQKTYKKITCGEMEIPYAAPKIVHTIYELLKIITPIIIIIFGSIDLIKAVVAQKEDDIKKGWKTFIQRLLVGSIVFVAFILVEFVVGLVAPHNENENMWDCIDCFVTGECENLFVGNVNND